jgi:multiple sugar transport system substrate-binding protein
VLIVDAHTPTVANYEGVATHMQINIPRMIGLGTAVAVAVSLVGCAGADIDAGPTGYDPEAEVTISVGGKPTSDKPEALAALEASVERFEEAHPNITIELEETRYDVATFSALLVGGTLPTTLLVPFTDIQSLIARGQAADVTDFIAQDDTLDGINPELARIVEDAEERSYGIVRNAYTMGLLYNRSLYEEAGLDPDSPPTTWDEVRANAIAITESTGQTGFVIPTTNNVGGWLTTAMSYSHGSLVEKSDGDTTTVAIDSEGMKESLEFLRDVRWEDGAAGSNFLYASTDVSDALAAGTVGQTVGGADAYNDLVVRRGMAPEDVGIAPLPLDSDAVGVLGGGSVQWFNPKATANEIGAAVEWMNFYYFERYTSEDAAVAWAKSTLADGLPVGVPALPLISDEAYANFLEWIEPYIDVDREAYRAYLDSLESATIVPEPAVKAQELYAALDPVVQAVLTREDADIDQLLADTQAQVQDLIDLG